MRYYISIWIIIFSVYYFQGTKSFAQITKVRGTVLDITTNVPIPFVNVTFKNSTIGTITNTDGEYFLETRSFYDTIVVSFVGYKGQFRTVSKYHFQEVNFLLEPNVYELDEIVVLPTENPAHPILRNIIANKEKHNPEKFDSYTYALYNKVEIDVNNVDEEFRNQRLLRDFQFIFDYVDTSAITGKSYLPIFITESFSDYYFNKNPKTEREII
ncbi:carboxypeptidase-like regulatory domain-containing protein, partial [Bacteroidota bacterium]